MILGGGDVLMVNKLSTFTGFCENYELHVLFMTVWLSRQ